MDLPASISTLQRTDRWVGVPLCAVLTLFRKSLNSRGAQNPARFSAFSLLSSQSKAQPFSPIPQFVVRSKWLGVRTFTSSYSKTTASSSMRWKLFPMEM